MNLAEILQRADEWLFHQVNYQLSAHWLDDFMRSLRYAPFWAPLYLALLYWFWKKMPEQFAAVLLISLLVFGLADSTSARVLKPLIGRIRPCYNETMEYVTRHIIGCGGKYSSPSSHAANHFALAMFWYCTVSRFASRKWRWLWLWALAIGWAQVYVGVHYPADIALGALLGVIIGGSCFQLLLAENQYRMKIGKMRPGYPFARNLSAR